MAGGPEHRTRAAVRTRRVSPDASHANRRHPLARRPLRRSGCSSSAGPERPADGGRVPHGGGPIRSEDHFSAPRCDDMSETTRVGDLEVAEDLTFQRREWAAQRVGWVLLALVIAAALAGLLGRGPLSTTRRESDGG